LSYKLFIHSAFSITLNSASLDSISLNNFSNFPSTSIFSHQKLTVIFSSDFHRSSRNFFIALISSISSILGTFNFSVQGIILFIKFQVHSLVVSNVFFSFQVFEDLLTVLIFSPTLPLKF
jgi:hypothetical protein